VLSVRIEKIRAIFHLFAMPKKDPRVDAYIARSADFAKPILNHIRRLVHAVCPEAQETVKWQMPHFEHSGVICGMAAFKQCASALPNSVAGHGSGSGGASFTKASRIFK
jgi:hypothetical protein